MSKTIFIYWKETENEFLDWRQGAIGAGILEPTFTEKEVVKRMRYSTENTPEMMERAEAYLQAERPEGWIKVEEE